MINYSSFHSSLLSDLPCPENLPLIGRTKLVLSETRKAQAHVLLNCNLCLCRDWPKFPIIRGPILGFHYNTAPYINFPHFGNSNLGKLLCV